MITTMSRAFSGVGSRNSRILALLTAAFVLLAAVLGLLSAADPATGLILMAVVVAAPLFILWPKSVPHLLVVSIFFGEAVALGEGLTLGRATAPIAAVGLIVHLLDRGLVLLRSKLLAWGVGGYFLIAIASLLWTQSLEGTTFALTSLGIGLIYILSFAVLLESESDLRRILATVTVSAGLLGSWWIWSYFSGIDRFENPAGDPNFFALYQVLAIPLCIALASHYKDQALVALLYLATALMVVSVVASISRGGLIALATTAIVSVLLPVGGLFSSRSQKRAVVATGLIVLVACAPVVWGDFNDRFQSEYGRLGLWRSALYAYQQQPMTGLGFGAYNELSFQLLAETPGALLEEHTQESLIEGRQVHNAYLEVLAEMGVVGVLFFLLLLVGIPVELRRAARLAGSSSLLRSTCGALICGAAGFVVASVFLSSNNNRALWVLVGMTLALGTMAKRLTEHELEPEGV